MSAPHNSQSEGRSLRFPKPENSLWKYVQAQGPQNAQDLSQQVSADALEILSHHIRGMLGNLPSEQFGVQISTSREGLAQLLSGAMMTGYYLRTQEEKLQLELMMDLPEAEELSENDHIQS